MDHDKELHSPAPSAVRQTFYNDNDELDMLDIVAQLWAGKKTIIATIVVFMLLAVAYIFLAKEKWTSEAIVSRPAAGQIANYNAALDTLYAQFPQDKIAIDDLQKKFFDRFSASVSALSGSLRNLELPLVLKVDQVVVGRDDPLHLSFTDHSAKEAQSQLAHYIQLTNEETVNDYIDDLHHNLVVKQRALTESLANQELVAEERKQQRIEVIKQALKIAEASNITALQLQEADFLSDDTLYLLGTKALSAMVQNEKTKPLVLDDFYYATQRSLIAIKRLKAVTENVQSFRYIMKPSFPVRRDSPQKALVLIFSVVLGGITGTMIVIGGHIIRTYREQR